MNLPHHKLGCAQCGKKRRISDVRAGTYDIYLTERFGTNVKVGLCRDCHAAGDYDLPTIQDNVAASEFECAIEKGYGVVEAENIRQAITQMEFDGTEKKQEFWAKPDPLKPYKDKVASINGAVDGLEEFFNALKRPNHADPEVH